MVPFSALVCSVSLYTTFMIRHIIVHQKTWLNRCIAIMWMFFLVLIFLENLFDTTYHLLWKNLLSVRIFMTIISKCDHLLLFIVIILFISNFFIRLNNKSLQRWFLFSGGATVFNFLVPVFIDPTPPWLFRFIGLIGLPMLFGWLMINTTILNIKYNPDIESSQMLQKLRSLS
jgi:hypothetical protein